MWIEDELIRFWGQKVKVEGHYKVILVDLEYHYILTAQWQHGYQVVISGWLELPPDWLVAAGRLCV